MRNVYHVTEDVSRASGGIRTVVEDLHRHFPQSTILTTQKDPADYHIKSFKNKGPWLYSGDFKDHLKALPCDSLFHIHGVWMHAQFTAATTAHNSDIPFILSPHGMYEPWLWKEGTLKKKLYFNLLTSSAFAKANYIHAITPDEQDNLQKLFPKSNVVCIPNAIDTPVLPERISHKKPYFLFLGRLHPKKGLDVLLEVFEQLKLENFDLLIAGKENEYSNRLKKQYASNSNQNIKFIGAVHGSEKNQLYRDAHAFVAPSYSEVIGMVNLEAAMMATPVITTHQTGILKQWSNNGGVLINPDKEELAQSIKELSKLGDQQRNEMGVKLREFVIRHYSWDAIGPMWKSLYQSMS
ncbi:glycosyltransferase [Nonlabens sp. YIK11]|uniref:glycosyltransferase n=1 Tax=Nonlabens sp. YIK11 TaxID=1453349 RepID=UPI0006DC25AA|nr:glycosyltransferase [Nonlabens sp. YIK11]